MSHRERCWHPGSEAGCLGKPYNPFGEGRERADPVARGSAQRLCRRNFGGFLSGMKVGSGWERQHRALELLLCRMGSVHPSKGQEFPQEHLQDRNIPGNASDPAQASANPVIQTFVVHSEGGKGDDASK